MPQVNRFLKETGKPPTNQDMILALEKDGFIVTKDEPSNRVIQLGKKKKGTVKFGIASDTHFGHKHQQLTHLEDFCQQARDFGVAFMLHGGDVVDGQNMHRDQQFELFKHGVDSQANYTIEHLPNLGVPWYAIGGNHDGSGWNDVGANVLRNVADARSDFNFLGAPIATFHYGNLAIRLMHPDGGLAYARSYKLQKIVEQMPPDDKPDILLCGHWHVANHLAGYRNVEAFCVPCFQSQTAYLSRKGLAPVIGGILFEADFGESGLMNLTTKWVLYRTPIVADY